MFFRTKSIICLVVIFSLCSFAVLGEQTRDLSFENRQGDEVYDSSFSEVIGTIHGGIITSQGKIGNALSLDGIDDYLDMGDSDFAIGQTNAFTLTLWVKLDTLPDQGHHSVIMRRGRYIYPFSLQVDAAGAVVFSIRTERSINLTSRSRLVPGQWYHITEVYEEGRLSLYLNGQEDRTSEVFGLLALDDYYRDELTSIGKKPGEDIHYLDGTLDEVKIFNHPLAEKEILALYEKENPGLPPGDFVIHLPDHALESCVRNTIDKPLGDIWKSDVVDLIKLEGYGNVVDITGLEHFSSLEYLELFHNRIWDIGPLKDLTGLQVLLLDVNDIEDITPLEKLVNLNALLLGSNRISDISPLAGMTKLNQLYIECNRVSDITPLSGMTELRVLILDYNQVSDLTPIGKLTNLEELWIGYNPPADLSAIAGLINLHRLGVEEAGVKDLTFLSSMKKIKFLYLSDNQIEDIGLLLDLPQLRSVTIKNNPLNRKSLEEYIPLLQARGVWVSYL